MIAINRSVKPIVGLVRGGAIGFGTTITTLMDFVYCSPDAFFSTPFMKSAQSPEGSATYSFAQYYGYRKANEILLLDKKVRAHEAKAAGYINDVLDNLGNDYFPDLDKIPAIRKLV